MTVFVVTAPTEEPVSVDEAKLHLKVDGTDEDAFIGALITAAREHAESLQNRAYVTQTLRVALPCWPGCSVVKLPRPRLQGVVSITYKQLDGTVATVDPSTYVVDADGEPGGVMLKPGRSWPSATLYPVNPITVTYTAGYGDATDVPQRIKQALLLLVGFWFESRDVLYINGNAVGVPFTVNSLLATDRVYQ